MTDGSGKVTGNGLQKLAAHLVTLLDTDPAEAVRQARQIDISSNNRLNAIFVRAAVLVDGGAASRQRDAMEEGLLLYRELHKTHPNAEVEYNIANALVAVVGRPHNAPNWLDHQESTREQRAEARRLYWRVARDKSAPSETRTQAWTNLANQLTNSYRLGEAHDARLAALAIDPKNGVAAGTAALDLLWLYEQGGCSDLTRVEAIMLAKLAKQHHGRVHKYAGLNTANRLASLADQLEDAPNRSPHSDPFVRWVERERLTLAPAVELVDPALGKLDWLMLPGITEPEPAAAATPPPIFAMFNMLKSDFIVARDLAWRAIHESGSWPMTGRFADTLDYATYGPEASALVLAHRTTLDILDKVAVTVNHYFRIGLQPNKVYFGKLWRAKGAQAAALVDPVEKAIRGGANALYALVELAEDYESEHGILRSHKDLRNAGTHRFVVLHDLGNPAESRAAPEVEHQSRGRFAEEVVSALRVARSALQMVALAIGQHERTVRGEPGHLIAEMRVPDHDWVRGRDQDSDGP